MFARKVRVEYVQDGKLQACPLKWLDSFSMRNFTNATVFDDTLPVADGNMEIGTTCRWNSSGGDGGLVPRKSYLAKDASLRLVRSEITDGRPLGGLDAARRVSTIGSII
jgi:hypothetical protein